MGQPLEVAEPRSYRGRIQVAGGHRIGRIHNIGQGNRKATVETGTQAYVNIGKKGKTRPPEATRKA
jgi:hypothetical protein